MLDDDVKETIRQYILYMRRYLYELPYTILEDNFYDMLFKIDFGPDVFVSLREYFNISYFIKNKTTKGITYFDFNRFFMESYYEIVGVKDGK